MSLIQELIQSQELMLARIDEMEREARDIAAERQVFSSRTLEEMPGKKHNWEVPINLDITAAGGTAQVRGTYTHSMSGLYVVTKLSAAWRETVQAFWRPISSVPDNEVAAATVNSIDFTWQIFENADAYSWSDDPVPSPLLFGTRERPFYLPIAGQITPNSTIRVEVTPTRAVANNGTLSFVLGGYIILDPPPFQQ